jgi:hypothetical protein
VILYAEGSAVLPGLFTPRSDGRGRRGRTGVTRRSVLAGATLSGVATAVGAFAQGAARAPRIGILNPGPAPHPRDVP